MKQKKQVITLGVLLVIAALVWYSQRSDTAPSSTSRVFDAEKYQIFSPENPQLRWYEIEKAQKTEYKGGGRNIFSKQAPVVVATNVKPAAVVPHHVDYGPFPPPPDPVPPPPQLPANLKYFGYGTVPNGTSRRAFFSDGDEVYIVAEGETLLGKYRIIKVNNNNLEFEEIASHRRNTAPLVEEPVAAAAAGGPT
jgi:hypothetical protein